MIIIFTIKIDFFPILQCLRVTLHDSADRASELKEQAIDLHDACYPLLMGMNLYTHVYACVYPCSHRHIHLAVFLSIHLYVKLQPDNFRTVFYYCFITGKLLPLLHHAILFVVINVYIYIKYKWPFVKFKSIPPFFFLNAFGP